MLRLGYHSVAGVVVRPSPHPISRLAPVSSRRGGGGGTVSSFSSAQTEKKEMEKNKGEEQQNDPLPDPAETHQGDAMSHSFGEGYATRCDEEGFGGVYGGNPSEITHLEYDKSQGSEVKEKEKARNQLRAA